MSVKMWSNRNPHICLVHMWNCTVTLEDSLVFSYKTKCTFTIWSAIALYGINSKNLKTYVWIKTCLQIFIEVLFIIYKALKATKMFSRRWMDKYSLVLFIFCAQTLKQYSELKHELSRHEKTWGSLNSYY